MLPLPRFTSGAKVGLLFRGLEVLMCCPATPFPVPVWETADQSSPWTGGPWIQPPPYPSQLYSDAFDLAVNQPLSLL